MTKENVCKHYNVGYCKFKAKCMFLHPTEECDNKCKRITYLKRHRKVCKLRNYCKKKKNEFKHDQKSDTNDQISELKRAVTKLLENKLKK